MIGSERVRIGVAGASGYAGGELVRLLAGRPDLGLSFQGARDSAGKTLGTSHPHLVGRGELAAQLLEPIDAETIAERTDVAFLALPHGTSAALAPDLVERGVRVIDLAGDFRLGAAAYPEWYGFDHPSPQWLDKAAYGLPELFASQVRGAQLVANPGCYPTPVILGLAPLLVAGLVEPGPVRVDGKTGLSGAGRKASEATLFSSTEESIRPYRVPGHQHTPEMERGIELASGAVVTVIFVPHLVPTVRGVLTTSYATLTAGATTDQLTDCLAAAYAGKPFVRVLPAGEMVDSKRVRGSNVVELQAIADPRTGTAILVGAVDNLVKGAAGQAIQNMNVALGLDEATGLPTLGVYP
jgi:N-acetyl-gamma-glutamyl-phosphate reductase